MTVIYTPRQSGSGPPCRMLQFTAAGGWVEIREQAQDTHTHTHIQYTRAHKRLQLDYHLCAHGESISQSLHYRSVGAARKTA